MRLKSIKLAGFKSFVDPTTLSFKSNLTAIVGPNGCGKSNVIDAVRWVMGESSAKYLRGENMADVIFNGSRNRQPLGQASIELIFENLSGKLGGAYASYTEISVKRLVTRDATSSYFLNGSKCRRKDITDIFLGTGLGPRSYAIIEQGMIARLIEARPEELRVYLEEAANISKYKERRRETQNRIQRTEENLERLGDILTELNKQLERLGKQAAAAKEFQTLRQEEKTLKAELAVLRWQQADQQLTSRLEAIKQQELAQEACLVNLRQQENQLETSREQQARAGYQLDSAQQQLTQLSMQIARLEQGIQHQSKRAQQLSQEIQQLNQEAANTQQALGEDASQLALISAQLEEVEPQLEDALTEQMTLQAQVSQLEGQLNQLNLTSQSQFAAKADTQRQAALAQQRIQQNKTQLARISQQLSQLSPAEEANSALTGLVEEVASLNLEEAQLEEALSQTEADTQFTQEALASQEMQLEALAKEEQQLSQKFQQQKARLTSLKTLQEAATQTPDTQVENWLAEEGLAAWPQLGQQLEPQAGWEKALEVVLASQLTSRLSPLPITSQLINQVNHLPAGNLWLASSSQQPPEINPASLLSKLLNPQVLPPSLAKLLNNYLLAASLEAAAQQLSQLTANQAFITQQGEILYPDRLLIQAPNAPATGFLARQTAINQLTASNEELADEQENAQEELAAGKQKLAELRQELNQLHLASRPLHNQLAEVASKKASLSAQLNHQQQLAQQQKEQAAALAEEQALLEEQLEEDLAQLEEAQLNLAANEEVSSQHNQQQQELAAELQQAKAKAEAASQQVNNLKLKQQQLFTQQQAGSTALNRLEELAANQAAKLSQLTLELASAEEPSDQQQDELDQLLSQHLTQSQQVDEIRQQVSLAQEEQSRLEKQRHLSDQQLNQHRQQLEALRLEQHSLMHKRDSHLEVLNELNLKLFDLLETLNPAAEETLWQAQLQAAQNKIKRLGAINLAAIDEYDQQAERSNYLSAQQAELEEALATLEGAIERIDQETKHRFKATFDQVNASLQQLFPKIFGGGTAWLHLTDQNLLETGVAIMARPPGKKNTSIHLLSGGEKALTALALVFSIFELNPAPFCMLDEVDAPLDDANVGRYAQLIQEMSASIQFIYITHNKQAMQSASQLMGVTMQEPGVSRLVSVDLAAAEELIN